MYVRTYVRMYVCICMYVWYVCMDGCIYLSMYYLFHPPPPPQLTFTAFALNNHACRFVGPRSGGVSPGNGSGASEEWIEDGWKTR